MVWTIEYDPDAEADLTQLDRPLQRKIVDYLEHRVAVAANPRQLGKPLRSRFRGLWRYRVGDYRIICRIEDQKLMVLVIAIGHRSEIYRT